MTVTPQFHTRYQPQKYVFPTARRPALARAVRADVMTHDAGPTLLWGEPKIGKSVLLRLVLWSLDPSDYLVSRIPIGSLVDPVTKGTRFAQVVGPQLAVQLEPGNLDLHRLERASTVTAAVEACRRAAEEVGRRWVLAVEGIDRYIDGVWPGGVLKSLEALYAKTDNLSLVCTARRPIAEITAAAAPEGARVHFVPPLSRKASRTLLESDANGGTRFAEEALEALILASGGRPFLLQALARNCARLCEGQPVDINLAKEVVESAWLGGEAVFRPLLAHRPKRQQLILSALAIATSDAVPQASFDRLLHVLEHIGGPADAAEVVNDLELLRVWRLVDSDDEDHFWHSIGWLGDYLRAGYRAKVGG